MLVSCSSQMTTTNYYFDSVNGDDANNGTSVGTPFKSLAKLQSLTLKGGDSILLKSGAVIILSYWANMEDWKNRI